MTATNVDNAEVKGKDNTSSGFHEQVWLFKVKRYPWAISYGNKKVDRTVEAAKHLVPQLTIPPPQNMDSDSGKSLIIFVLKVIYNIVGVLILNFIVKILDLNTH